MEDSKISKYAILEARNQFLRHSGFEGLQELREENPSVFNELKREYIFLFKNDVEFKEIVCDYEFLLSSKDERNEIVKTFIENKELENAGEF